jgi:hypothetical protein
MVDQLIVSPIDAGHVRLVLAENSHITLQTGPLDRRDGRLHVRLEAPWLYPPREHPFWDPYSPGSRDRLQALVSMTVEGKVYSARAAHPFDAAAFDPVVLGADGAAQGSPFVEAIARAPAPR